MRILSHYFIARFYGSFLTVLVAAMGILATVELVLNLEELASLRDAEGSTGPAGRLATSMAFLWTRLASLYLSDLLPVAAFAATFLTFAIAGRQLEWIAIEASGIRPLRVILPVIAAAGLLGIGAGILGETVVLRARHIRLVENRFDPDEIELERRAFWYHRGPIITNIGHADPAARTLHDVELFERGVGDDSGRILRIIRAPAVRILPDGRWHFDEALVWRFDPKDPLAEPRFENARHLELDLESVPRNPLENADPAIAPLETLAHYVSSLADTPSPQGRRLAQAYHQRLSRPVSLLALCWLALPFGIHVDRRGRFAPAATGALLALSGYFALSSAGAALTRLTAIPVGLASWGTPVLALILAGMALVRRRV
ncbi:MAG: LptF/LptG family permease [Deltaproteobacteria bacterium]|nr:LptF/LptG family permease [Deltaproteobacteria bacterium]